MKPITLELDDREREVLAMLPDFLAQAGEEGVTRLKMPAFPDSPTDDEEFWDLVGGDLNRAREGDRAALAETLERQPLTLSAAEAEAWLRVLAEGRLILGARAGIVEEADYERVAANPALPFMAYLAWVQVSLISQLDEPQ